MAGNHRSAKGVDAFREKRATWVAGRKPYTEEQRKEKGLDNGSWKQRHPEIHAEHARAYRLRNKEKIAAQNAVAYAARKGQLPDGTPFKRGEKCEYCGILCKCEADHFSYEKKHWFDVKWVCHPCHVRIGKLRGQTKNVDFQQRRYLNKS